MTVRTPDKRRYVAESMNEVLERIKRDFGDDGRIISTREYVEGGFFGFLGKRKYEVIAVCPKKSVGQKSPKRTSLSGNDFLNELLKGAKSDNLSVMDDKQKQLLNTLGLVKSKSQPQDLHKDQAKQLLNDLFKTGEGSGLRHQSVKNYPKTEFQVSTSNTSLRSSKGDAAANDEINSLKSEMKEIQMGLKELRQFMMQGPSVKSDRVKPSVSREVISETESMSKEVGYKSVVSAQDSLDSDSSVTQESDSSCEQELVVERGDTPTSKQATKESLNALRSCLLDREFDPDLASTYVNVMTKIAEDKPDHSWTLRELKDSLKNRYKETAKVRPSIFSHLKDVGISKPKIMVFVGPTGVGKTTTIAKLATCLSSEENGSYKVALITIDTFKVGAVSQIKYYAQGIKADLEVVFRPEDILPAIEKHSDKDVILIDTVGRGPKSKMQISSLKDFLPDSLNAEIHLCMSATSRYKDMIETIKAFNHLGVDSLLFTKLDETSTYGPMLSILQKNTRDISYVTTGQLVPGDYRVIDRSYLAELMFSESH